MNIWWIRRDLRLSDNAALQAALAEGSGVVPLVILDPHALLYPAAKRQAFLLDGLRRLADSLRACGSRLVVRQGSPAEVLPAVAAQMQAQAVFAEEGYSPYARRRDEDLAALTPLRLCPGRTVHHPGSLTKQDGNPYTVYTPFMRYWKTLPLPSAGDLLPAPTRLPPVPDSLLSDELPEANPPELLPAGEAEGRRRLASFAQGDDAPICQYRAARDQLAEDGTSTLSPYLRFGMVSARQAVVAALNNSCRSGGASPAPSSGASPARPACPACPAFSSGAFSSGAFPSGALLSGGAETWLNELIWREFYQAILWHFPTVLQEALRADLRAIPWQNDDSDFAAWCEARTGYPVVDAAMRQLVQTGWMHNRARMIVASFLVKDLLVDWRWGERFFMEHLIDGDPAANNGGWQWTAGVGADAAPYFRIFNPILQARKFDAQGAYVRRWLPELAAVPDEHIHAPWDMPLDGQRAAGCVIGQDYPAPMIDHALARQRTLAAYRVAE